MKNIFPSTLFIVISFSLIITPYFALAVAESSIMPYYPVYDWGRIIFISLIIFLITFLMWLFSPLGLIFIASTLVQFLISKKEIRLVAWVIQSLIFVFTILLGAIGIIFSLSRYGEQRYSFLVGFIGTAVIICLLMLGAMVSQFIWQRRKTDVVNIEKGEN